MTEPIEGAGAGEQWSPSFEMTDDGKAKVEIAKGEYAEMSTTEAAQYVSKGRGFEKRMAEFSTKEKEWKTKEERLQEMEDLFGPTYERLAKRDPAEAEKYLREFEGALDGKGQTTTQQTTGNTGGTSWLDNILNDGKSEKPNGLTEDAVNKIADKRLHDFETKLKAESALDAAMSKLGIPESLKGDFGMRVLNKAKRISDIAGIAEEQFKQEHEAHLSIEERKRQEIAAQKERQGGNVTRMGRGAASTNSDPRSKMPLGSPERKAYIAERMIDRAQRG